MENIKNSIKKLVIPIEKFILDSIISFVYSINISFLHILK